MDAMGRALGFWFCIPTAVLVIPEPQREPLEPSHFRRANVDSWTGCVMATPLSETRGTYAFGLASPSGRSSAANGSHAWSVGIERALGKNMSARRADAKRDEIGRAELKFLVPPDVGGELTRIDF